MLKFKCVTTKRIAHVTFSCDVSDTLTAGKIYDGEYISDGKKVRVFFNDEYKPTDYVADRFVLVPNTVNYPEKL